MYLGYVYNSHLEHSYIVLRVVQCFMSRLRKEKVQKSPMWSSNTTQPAHGRLARLGRRRMLLRRAHRGRAKERALLACLPFACLGVSTC